MMVEESKESFLDFQEGKEPKTRTISRQKRLLYAIGLCFILFLIQLGGGYFTSSLALLSDAFHMLSDVIGYTISLTSIILASSPSTARLPFGKKRLEVLGALASIGLLWVLTGGLVYEASERLSNPKEIDGRNMFMMAVFGVIVNGILIFIFGAEEGHEVDKQELPLKDVESGFENVDMSTDQILPTQEHTKTDINIRAAMLHAIGDLLCSVGVLIASIVIWINPSMTWVDPFCTFLFGVMAIGTTLGILRDIFNVLMQSTPDNFDEVLVCKELMLIDGVVSVDLLQV